MLNRKHVLNKDLNVSCSLFHGKQRVEHALTGQRCLSISLLPLCPPPATDPAPQELLPFNPGRCKKRLPLRAAHKVQGAWKHLCHRKGAFSLHQQEERKAHDWNLAAIPACFLLLGWGGPRQALSWSACCAWGLLCCSLQIHLWVYSAAGRWGIFFPPEEDKIRLWWICGSKQKYAASAQHIGYAITLFFDYTALTHGRAALLNLVAEQGGSRKGSIWCNCLLQTNAGFVRAVRGRKNLIFHIMTTLERQFLAAKSLHA